jgi:hypothetical protein
VRVKGDGKGRAGRERHFREDGLSRVGTVEATTKRAGEGARVLAVSNLGVVEARFGAETA